MNRKVLALFVAAIAAASGFLTSFLLLQPQLSALQQRVLELTERVRELEAQFTNMTGPAAPSIRNVTFRAEPFATGLSFPVSIAFAPDGRIFVNERTTGKIRVIQNGVLAPQPFAQLDVVLIGETGLLGLALHPNYERQPYVYVYYTYRAASGEVFNRVARFQELEGEAKNMEIILDRIPAAGIHNGGILAFGRDGKLYVSTGDTADTSLAQRLDSLAGKVLRLNPDGTIPVDNPFPGSPVYSLGHRNVFGLAFHPVTGRLYITENGPARDDELNIILPGGNYGWPIVLGVAHDPRFIDPIRTYTPNIAPTGLAFVVMQQLPAFYRFNLLFGDWNTGRLHRIILEPPDYMTVQGEEIILDLSEGILDVKSGPDGTIYLTTPTAILKLLATLTP